MANKFHVNQLLLSGQNITANNSNIFLNGAAVNGGGPGSGIASISGLPLSLGSENILGIISDTANVANAVVLRDGNGDINVSALNSTSLDVEGPYDGRIILNRGALGGYSSVSIRDRGDGLWNFGILGDETDFTINETYPAARRITIQDSVGEADANYQLYLSKYARIGIINNNPLYTLDASGTGNFSKNLLINNVPVVSFSGISGIGSITVITGSDMVYISGSQSASSEVSSFFPTGILTSQIEFIKTTDPIEPSSNNNTIYMDNFAQRGILSYINNRGIGKQIQNTLALENIHNFSPNTTTSMNVIGTTATSIGTLSHPTTFFDLTGFGYCTNILGATLNAPMGIQSATVSFFLTSGTTGIGAGFYMATQFALTGNSGIYFRPTGTLTGQRFFCGMTDGTTVQSTNALPWSAQALIGFQWLYCTGTSGRADSTYKFVTKDNGASSPMYIQDTLCPVVPSENISMYIYGRNDFRNGIHWMIRRLRDNIIYSGDFTGSMRQLPLVTSVASRLLKPSIGIYPMSGFNVGLRIKGLYCETV